MQSEQESLSARYDRNYRCPNYFRYREWLYRPFMKAMVKRARLEPGARILDAGCGQGFFTWLFADLGFTAVGADISSEGIRAAHRQYGSTRARYIIADVSELGFRNIFHCVFTRGCSLYNKDTL